ncbi:hypothetical protein FACS189415_2940 [Bacteroidia bacterium]|nr:hypothetical protein FACS189426_16690 [Bacteroidia bacterium]GHT29204.1 hypothetical protein FACS189432_08180 [Bacteroidia bacterium]GHU82463.1 hypothetical protein FACS189415_2940 [Bacteroidia bacterium]
MNKFSKIYLAWRHSKGQPRVMIGEITQQDNDVNFRYLYDGVNQARRDGFMGYPGLSVGTTEHKNVLSLFATRLINIERSDAKELLKFWRVQDEYIENKLYLLAMTQGMSQNDNFEFLACFELREDLSFITDIAGLSHSLFDIRKLKKGDEFTFKRENLKQDKNAIKILFGQDVVGYIKKGHNEVFIDKEADNLKIVVEHIVNTNDTKQVFVKVFNPLIKTI